MATAVLAVAGINCGDGSSSSMPGLDATTKPTDQLPVEPDESSSPIASDVETQIPPDLSGGKIAFSRQINGNDEIFVMNSDGSAEARLTDHGARDLEPDWSPDGARIAFSSNRDGDFDIYVIDADGRNLQQITNDHAQDSAPKWSPDGRRIAFFSTRRPTFLWVMDATAANPKPVLQQAMTSPVCGGGGFPGGWSPDSEQITFFFAEPAETGETLGQICVVRLDGSGLKVLASDPPNFDVESSWSHDGTRMAFRSARDGENSDVYVMEADGSDQRRLTSDPATDSEPSFSADDRWLVFHSSRNTTDFELYAIRADGTGLFQLTHNPANDNTPAWSPR